jgi:hypothetical protein
MRGEESTERREYEEGGRKDCEKRGRKSALIKGAPLTQG